MPLLTTKRAESVAGGTPSDQLGRGGSIPASALYFHAGDSNEAAELVNRFHYSHRMPSNPHFVGALHFSGGLFGTKGDCQCACIFSSPPTRWSEPVLELSRLVRREGIRVPLTLLIRLTVSKVKASGSWDLLASFADSTQGHHGGVYQAAGWTFGGTRDPQMDGVINDGIFVPGRTCNARWGTRSPALLAERGIVVEPHYDEGKHLYWKALNRSGEAKAARLGLKSLPYPKPGKESPC